MLGWLGPTRTGIGGTIRISYDSTHALQKLFSILEYLFDGEARKHPDLAHELSEAVALAVLCAAARGRARP